MPPPLALNFFPSSLVLLLSVYFSVNHLSIIIPLNIIISVYSHCQPIHPPTCIPRHSTSSSSPLPPSWHLEWLKRTLHRTPCKDIITPIKEPSETNPSIIRPTETDAPTMPTNAPSLPSVPSSLLPVFMTAVPASYIEAFGDPSKMSSLGKGLTTESWYQDLPSGAKSYLSGIQSQYATVTGDMTTADTASITSAETSGTQASETTSASGSDTESAASETGSATTSASDSDSESTGSASTSDSGSATGTGAESSTSTAGAPAPTGHFAATVAGAAGLIGLVAAL